MESWKPVVGFEGRYEVSDLGRVRGLDRVVRHGGRCSPDTMIERKGSVLHPSNSRGYRVVNLKGRTRLVHSLVLEAFVGLSPDGMEGCHNNGIPHDNRLENLRWDTHTSNAHDRRKHGTAPFGEKNWNARLTKECVARIRDMRAAGAKQKDIGAWFGIEQPYVSLILLGKRWPHLKGCA